MIRKLILFLLLTTPVLADDAPLFIERIEVRNHERVSPDVVIAESRLRAGREYTEADLRDAATRLSRLPFLLSVEFSLERGSERGRHVLILTINETKPFFFLIDAVPYLDGGPFIGIEYDDRFSDRSNEKLVAGFRWFVGRRSAVHVGFAAIATGREFSRREYAALSVGYTQYDLFGTRAFATINLNKPMEGFGEGLLTAQAAVGMPVAANQTVTLQYDEIRLEGEVLNTVPGLTEDSYGQRLVTARWSYNTTNEPFFPTRGTLLHVTPLYGWVDGTDVYKVIDSRPPRPRYEVTEFHRRVYGAQAGVTRYFEISERDSLFGDLRGEWARKLQSATFVRPTFGHNAHYASIGGGYSYSLWTREERANGDSRLELTARYSHRSRPPEEDPYRAEQTSQVAASWLRRSSWGTLRLGAGYAW